MDDLRLWALLDADELDADAVGPLLAELAKLSVHERAPYFGSLSRALRHPSAALRVAALRALDGASGPLAVRAMVEGLEDGDPKVRAAAVEALRSIGGVQPLRFAHALFHREPDVRALAIRGELPPNTGPLAFYLLADPELSSIVEARNLRPPSYALEVVIELANDGRLGMPTARRILAETPPDQVVAWASYAPWRAPDEIARVLASQGGDTPGHDRLDDLFALFLRPPADDPYRARLFTMWTDYLWGATAIRSRVAASLAVAMRREGYASDALGLAVNHAPEILAWTSIPRAMREASLDAVYRAGPRMEATSSVREALWASDLVHRPRGGLDLRFLGATLCFAPLPRYEPLAARFGQHEIVAAFLRDPRRSARFFSVTDRSSKGREWMLGVIASAARPEQQALVYALFARVSPGNELAPIAEVAAPLRIAVLEELLGLEHDDALGFDTQRAMEIAHAIVQGDLRGHESAVLECWLKRHDAGESALGEMMLARMSAVWKTDALIDVLAALPTYPLRRLLGVLDAAPRLSVGQERALAARLLDHSSPKVAAWAESRTAKSAGPAVTPIGPAGRVTPIPEWLAARLRSDPSLEDATVERLHGAPTIGLAAILRERAAAPAPSVAVAVALLGSHDPIADVAAQFERYTDKSGTFMSALDEAAVAAWNGQNGLPLACDAWLWRFEKHGLRALETLLTEGLADRLREALELPAPIFAENLWAAAGSSIAAWRHRARERLAPMASDALFDLCVDALDSPVGYWAARILVAFHESKTATEALAAREARAMSRLPDVSDEVRRTLEPYVVMRGLTSRGSGARGDDRALPPELLARIRASTDLDELAECCRGTLTRAVHEAAVRLVVLGEAGCARIADLLVGEEPVPHHDALAVSIPLWSAGTAALDRLRRWLASGAGAPELRFRIALGLLDHGDASAFEVAVHEACVPAASSWMTHADFERLKAKHEDTQALACALAISPHHHAYVWAVQEIARTSPRSAAELAALRLFLAQGTARATHVRVIAAKLLHDHNDMLGVPILASAGLDAPFPTVLAGASARDVERVVTGMLFTGGRAPESTALSWLDQPHVDYGAKEIALEIMLAECDDETVRAGVVQRLPRRPTRAAKLRLLAHTFAWGVVAARELLGRVYRVHMIATSALGYTRLNERRVYVTPLPILRGERRGREIVEGLILHELGHHRHHAGPANQEVWNRAQQKGLQKLLNLVADEHLERNLRSVDPTYGDRLKRLAAYAFQHAAREIDVWVLVRVLGARTLPILSACRLGAARRPTAVRVGTGEVLTLLEASGSSFAKFVRALRMGLGRRHEDAKVNAALELFEGGAFRRSDMERLYLITEELHRIFGAEVRLMDAFGGAESLEDSTHDRISEGEGIEDSEVQRAVERILGPPGEKERGGRPSSRGPLQVNVAEDESFDEIHEVVRVEPNLETHREVARRVARHARRLRETLERLGLAREPSRMRLSGHRLDTTRIRPLVTHGDPRVLVARKTVISSDLYLGIVIDCSGSMHGESMERAHAFGVLLAEAVRGLSGVDLGIFGFDDRVIFDAGDARRPAVTSLEAGEGNNDAAGLLHAAKAAMKSRRKAKVLVMISDGLPTECSASALRALAKNLTRRHGLCCAQVAVRPLEEVCFKHYVEIDDEHMDAAVRKFGSIVAKLVGRTLSS
jgi:hypothetical protein